MPNTFNVKISIWNRKGGAERTIQIKWTQKMLRDVFNLFKLQSITSYSFKSLVSWKDFSDEAAYWESCECKRDGQHTLGWGIGSPSSTVRAVDFLFLRITWCSTMWVWTLLRELQIDVAMALHSNLWCVCSRRISCTLVKSRILICYNFHLQHDDIKINFLHSETGLRLKTISKEDGKQYSVLQTAFDIKRRRKMSLVNYYLGDNR